MEKRNDGSGDQKGFMSGLERHIDVLSEQEHRIHNLRYRTKVDPETNAAKEEMYEIGWLVGRLARYRTYLKKIYQENQNDTRIRELVLEALSD